jgi:hypothetical protein
MTTDTRMYIDERYKYLRIEQRHYAAASDAPRTGLSQTRPRLRGGYKHTSEGFPPRPRGGLVRRRALRIASVRAAQSTEG